MRIEQGATKTVALYVAGDRPTALPAAGESHDAPWWETPYGKWRLGVEIEAMRRFPEFQAVVTDDGRLGWVGRLHSSLEPDNTYLVHVGYPGTYPDDAPSVTILEPTLESESPHLIMQRQPCLFRPTEGPRRGYDPGRTTAATLVAWTALWIHAYETWRETGKWPGRGD
jgi:hypothetical protein